MIQAVSSMAGCVQEKVGLDADTKNRLSGAVSRLAARVQRKIESAQERIDLSLESIKQEHERFVAECEAEETCDPNERDCDDDLVLYAGQRGALPWIISGEEDSDLRSEVMALSVREATFRDGAAEGYGICVTQRKALILELLALDPNLKSMHAKLSTRLRESVFWTNYFYHCAALRRRRKAERCRSSRSDLPTHLETTLAVSVLPSGAGINAPSVSAKDDDDAAVPRTDEATPDRTDLLPILSATDVVAPLTTDEDTIPGTEETKVFSTSSVNLSAPNLATLLISDHGTPPAIEESTLPTAHKSNPREIGISGENLGAESADDDEDLDSWLDDDDFRATTAQLASDGDDYDLLSDNLFHSNCQSSGN